MANLRTWKLTLLTVILLLAAFLAAAQATTIAWLSNFPDRASQLKFLEFRFWGYAALSITLLIFGFGLMIYLIKRRLNERKANSK